MRISLHDCHSHSHGPYHEVAPPVVVSRILVADDDPTSAMMLEHELKQWGFEVDVYQNGLDAWEAISTPDAPNVLIVDWVMPGLDGLELMKRARAIPRTAPLYIIMLTSNDQRGDAVIGLEAGADDYLSKPAHREELRARIMNGVRIVELQLNLTRRISELESALAKVKQLEGLLPMCAYCKKVRRDGNYWQQVEAYFASHSNLRFSHGICPSCYDTIIEPQLAEIEQK